MSLCMCWCSTWQSACLFECAWFLRSGSLVKCPHSVTASLNVESCSFCKQTYCTLNFSIIPLFHSNLKAQLLAMWHFYWISNGQVLVVYEVSGTTCPLSWLNRNISTVVTTRKYKWVTACQNQQNDKCAQRRLRSVWKSAQSDLSLRCPHEEPWVLSYPLSTQQTLDQTGWMPRLIWDFAGRTVILLVLSRGGSYLNSSLSIWLLTCVPKNVTFLLFTLLSESKSWLKTCMEFSMALLLQNCDKWFEKF